MRRTTPGELDGTNRGDLSIGKVCILGFEIDDQLTHGDRQRPMMVFSLGFGRPEEADHAMRIKGISGSTQAPFRQARFLRPFCWWNAEKHDRSDPLIQALLWGSTPLLEQMVVVRSLPAFSLGLWHTRSSKMEAKEMRRRGILCQLDDLLVMLQEKLDRDKILFQNIGRFSHHSTGFRGASVIVTARICKPSVARFEQMTWPQYVAFMTEQARSEERRLLDRQHRLRQRSLDL